jgi:hypothetical protein
VFQSGLGASVFAGGWPGTSGTAANASPQGPATVGQQAFGVVAGSTGGSAATTYAALSGGAIALAALAFIWWSLPR